MGQLKFLKNKPWFAIKKGVLYQYEKKTSRDCMDKFNISLISAIAMIVAKPKDENDIDFAGLAGAGVDKLLGSDKGPQAQFQMIYQDFYCIFTVEEKWLAEKWVNSIKLI